MMSSSELRVPETVGPESDAGLRPDRAAGFKWRRIAYLMHVSRALDALEEELCAQGEIAYQFSARGHDLLQVMLGDLLTHPHDGVAAYYRSRPLLLSLGAPIKEVLRSVVGKGGGYSNGRDIGVVFNRPGNGGPTALPMAGGVGSQYSPAVGWAQALRYRRVVRNEERYAGAIAVAAGGDGSVAASGFWAGIVAASTLELPVLFVIEDNGYGISVPSHFQTPNGEIGDNLAAFSGLRILKGDGADPAALADILREGVSSVREGRGPCLLHLKTPRLQGHSYQDKQAYRAPEDLAQASRRDPLPRLRDHLTPGVFSRDVWDGVEEEAKAAVRDAWREVQALPEPDPGGVGAHVFSGPDPQACGGQRAEGTTPGQTEASALSDGPRINLADAIRRTLDAELRLNTRLVVFGQDVGVKGGVHGVTRGLREAHGAERVFDTSLSEESIVGRAIGMALCGLVPAPEIQFRKYAEPAMEQIADCGSMRWRTNNRFAAPMVLRIPVGAARTGDPWHSQTKEAEFVRMHGWLVAAPSNAADAAGLLRTALRGDDPVVFLEHRALLDAASARRPYPGDDYGLAFGRAATLSSGDDLTLVTWGGMVAPCLRAAAASSHGVEVIDLRTLWPWDRETVLASVRRTRRCLVVHEDSLAAGIGAELAAVVAEEAFLDLDAPAARLGMADIPPPHAPALLGAALPSAETIGAEIERLARF